MADKKLNELTTASDGAYVYAEDASGNQIKISKADLASVVAGVIKPISFQSWTNNVDADSLSWGAIYCGNNCTNVPDTFCYILTLGSSAESGDERVQIAIKSITGDMYVRSLKQHSWIKLN